MPGVESPDLTRIVLDESSFDFRNEADTEIELCFELLSDVIESLRKEGRTPVAVPPMWDGVQCLDDCELYEFLSGARASGVDRDVLRRVYSLLSKCPEWRVEDLPGVDLSAEIRINDGLPTLALSVAYALAMSGLRRGVACLTFGTAKRRGFLRASGTPGEAELFFFTFENELPGFWRSLFALEDVRESEFITFARLAFPHVILHPDVTFRRFDGTYDLLRDRVAVLIGAINDHFLEIYRQRNGLTHEIQAAFGQYNCDLSMESPNTRQSEKLMRQRDVTYMGRTYRCEWHAKLERHRNRIHFALLDGELSGKILVGIFVSHLDT